MRSFVAFFWIAFLFVSCSKKQDDVKPADTDLGAQIAGTYKGTKFVENGIVYSLPDPNLTIGLKLTRITNTKAQGLITFNLAGVVAEDGGEVDLKSVGTQIQMYDGATKVGYVEGNKIYYEEKEDDGTIYKIEGIK